MRVSATRDENLAVARGRHAERKSCRGTAEMEVESFMMLYPAMGELNARIHNRYMLVNVVARRARQIAEAYDEARQVLNEKPVTIAINEVADGLLYDPENEVREKEHPESAPEEAEQEPSEAESAEASETVEAETETPEEPSKTEATETEEASEAESAEASAEETAPQATETVTAQASGTTETESEARTPETKAEASETTETETKSETE